MALLDFLVKTLNLTRSASTYPTIYLEKGGVEGERGGLWLETRRISRIVRLRGRMI